MASTVYKGDLSEVTFGKECGLALAFDGFGGLRFTTNAAGTVITFTGGTEGFFSSGSLLRYPVGMLVGSQLRVIGGGNFTLDDNATKGHVYTIVANSGDTITVSPPMKELSTTSASGDELLIDTMGTPTIDVGSTHHANAVSADESVLTNQFIGLAATVGLPETKVEVRRAHIVGVGRDVVIQEPQRFSNEGGSLETMMNSARWLYYALGREVIDEPTAVISGDPTATSFLDIAAGDTYVGYTGTLSNLSAGEYIIIKDSTATAFPKDTPPASADGGASAKWGSSDGLGIDMENTERNEIRQVLYVDTTTRRLHLEDPVGFSHTGYTLKRVAYDTGSSNGSPDFVTTAANYGTITNRQSRLLFSGATLPTFSIESSIRTHNVGSFNANSTDALANEAAPGSANDSKQLTRVWKGCKVKDFSIAADADAEVKLSINFDALYCYTDTGRLEDAHKGDRYTAHRMFENTANSVVNRKKAGIAPNTEKPFFFYNGQISSFGINIAQVTNFSLSGNNNAEAIYTIRGNSQAEDRNTAGQSLEQIPFGGSRNANLMIEKAMEYELSMSIIASDPLIWHEFRTNRTHAFTEPITLTLTKAGSGANREEVIIVIDDYIITEAPLPIPEDKGVIKSELKIMPKHVRVISHDAFLHM